jgi:cytochrome d ubiquinol oxidase subunit I
MHLLQLPDEKNERNSMEYLLVPNLVSLLAFHDPQAEVKGLKDFPKDERPPVLPVFLSFRAMVGLGTYFILASALAVFLSFKQNLEDYRLFLTVLLFSIPLPYIANQLGWIVAEVGRQPWIVYGVLKTAAGVSKNISTAQVAVSLAGFTLLYGALGVIDIYLLGKYARKGPDNDLSGIITVQGRD